MVDWGGWTDDCSHWDRKADLRSASQVNRRSDQICRPQVQACLSCLNSSPETFVSHAWDKDLEKKLQNKNVSWMLARGRARSSLASRLSVSRVSRRGCSFTALWTPHSRCHGDSRWDGFGSVFPTQASLQPSEFCC